MTKIFIQVGKSYICRNGSMFIAEAITNYPGTYKVQGVDEKGRVTWRSLKGRFDSHPHALDVVRTA